MFDTGSFDGFKGTVNRWLLPELCFSVFRGADACGVAKAIFKQFRFSLLGLIVLLVLIINNYYYYALLVNTLEHLRTYLPLLSMTLKCGA